MTHDPHDAVLTRREGETLLAIARWALIRALEQGLEPDPRALLREFEVTRGLARESGVFVTVYDPAGMRGCIGIVEPRLPLFVGAAENAVAAGTRDPRFSPVAPDELEGCTLEVTVLSAPVEVAGPDEIDVPRHGIRLCKGGREAVFLPAVARERGWDLDRTLSELSRKAGLEGDAWRGGASFQVFESQEFRENR